MIGKEEAREALPPCLADFLSPACRPPSIPACSSGSGGTLAGGGAELSIRWKRKRSAVGVAVLASCPWAFFWLVGHQKYLYKGVNPPKAGPISLAQQFITKPNRDESPTLLSRRRLLAPRRAADGGLRSYRASSSVAAMGEPSKELLDLPSEPRPPASFIESLLARREQPEQKPDKEGKRKPGQPTDPLPKSQVLGKVQDFLGEIAKANERLQHDAQSKPPEEYDIEALTGNEKEYIEMDLLLGVADLHSEQAVEAAEATMNGLPPSGKPFACDSSDSEDDSDEDGGDQPNLLNKGKCKGPDEAQESPTKGKKASKRQKVVVLD